MAGRTQLAPTFLDILKDSITKVAEVYWAPYNLNKKEFDIKGMITFYNSQGLFRWHEFPGSWKIIIVKSNRTDLSK